MSDLKITQLTTLAAAPDNADWLPIVDVSDTTMSASGTTKKIAASRFVNTNADKTFVTGDGTTGVLPVAGTVAVVSRANTFTQAQTITPATVTTALDITLPTGASSVNGIAMNNHDNGASTGPRILIGYNSNGSTPAAGALAIRTLGGAARLIWPDATGLLRIGTSAPTNATDTSAGSAVGDQTSNIAMKDIAGTAIPDADALAAIVEAADAVQRFTYKSGAYSGQEFSGIVLEGETLGRYGKDASADYPAGRSLNDVNLFGDLVKAVRYLAARVTELEAIHA